MGTDKFSIMRGIIKKVRYDAPFNAADVNYLMEQLAEIRNYKEDQENCKVAHYQKAQDVESPGGTYSENPRDA